MITTPPFVASDRAALAAIKAVLADLAEQQRHHTFLLQSILTTQERVMAALDDFISSMTAKMTAETTEIAGLKTFVQGLFDQIRTTVPALTPGQQTALDMLQAATDQHAASITAAMLDTPPVPPAV